MTSERRFGHVSQSGPPLRSPYLPPFHFCAKGFAPLRLPARPTIPFFVRRFRSLLIPPSLNITRNPPSLLLPLLWFLRSVRRRGRGGSSMLGRSRSVGRPCSLSGGGGRPRPLSSSSLFLSFLDPYLRYGGRFLPFYLSRTYKGFAKRLFSAQRSDSCLTRPKSVRMHTLEDAAGAAAQVTSI